MQFMYDSWYPKHVDAVLYAEIPKNYVKTLIEVYSTMRSDRFIVIIFILAALLSCPAASALTQTSFPTSYLYGDITQEFEETYTAYDENATIDIDGDSVPDLRLSVRFAGSTHRIDSVNGAYFAILASDTAETAFTPAQMSIDMDTTSFENNTLSYSTAGARTVRLDVYTTSGDYAHVIITMHAVNATDNLYSYESYLQTDDTYSTRFSAYALTEAYSVSVSGLKYIDGGAGSDYLYAATDSAVYKIARDTGDIESSNTDYTGIDALSFDDIHNHVIIGIINNTDTAYSGDIIVLNESLQYINSTKIQNATDYLGVFSWNLARLTGVDAGDFNGDGNYDIFYSGCYETGGGACMVEGFEYDHATSSISSVFYQTATPYGLNFQYVYGVAVGDTNSDSYDEVNFFAMAKTGVGDTIPYSLVQYKVDGSYTNLSVSYHDSVAAAFWWNASTVSRDNIDIADYDDSSSRDEVAFIDSDQNFHMYYGIAYDGNTSLPYVDDVTAFGLTGIDDDELALQKSDGTVVFYKKTVGAEDFFEKLAGTVNVTYAGLYTRLGGDYAIGSSSTSDDVLFLGDNGYVGFNANTVSSYEPCAEDWYTGAWRDCVAGTQTREVTDLNDCGTEAGKPAASQSCDSSSYGSASPNTSMTGSGDLQTYELYTTCQPQYECTPWSDCVNYMKTQTCVDVNHCPNTVATVYRRSKCVESDNVYWAEEIHSTVLTIDAALWPPFANITMIVFAIALLVTIFHVFIDLFNLFRKKGGQI